MSHITHKSFCPTVVLRHVSSYIIQFPVRVINIFTVFNLPKNVFGMKIYKDVAYCDCHYFNVKAKYNFNFDFTMLHSDNHHLGINMG